MEEFDGDLVSTAGHSVVRRARLAETASSRAHANACRCDSETRVTGRCASWPAPRGTRDQQAAWRRNKARTCTRCGLASQRAAGPREHLLRQHEMRHRCLSLPLGRVRGLVRRPRASYASCCPMPRRQSPGWTNSATSMATASSKMDRYLPGWARKPGLEGLRPDSPSRIAVANRHLRRSPWPRSTRTVLPRTGISLILRAIG